MFNGKRYLTRGVANEIPMETQIYLWGMIDELRETQTLDYLQVFHLSIVEQNGRQMQRIQHRQEQPKYENAVTIRSTKPVCNRIFYLGDGQQAATMISEESKNKGGFHVLEITSENDLTCLKGNLSTEAYHFILHWYQRLYNGYDPQIDLYCIPEYVGSLGAVWIAQSNDDVNGKTFLDGAKFQFHHTALYVCTFFDNTGECIDLFIPEEMINADTRKELSQIITNTYLIKGEDGNGRKKHN